MRDLIRQAREGFARWRASKTKDERRDAYAGTVVVLVFLTFILWLGIFHGGFDTGGPARTAGQVRTEHCEASWQNSAVKQYGGSKSAFMDRCRADLKAIEGATR